MKVTLIGHTQLSRKFREILKEEFGEEVFTDGQAIALTAIRTCYSPNKPSEIIPKEGAKYFGSKATDGQGGTEADRLIRMIFASKHTSTLEGISFNFAVEGVSRALLAQLTRHRVGFSFSVQSQRYVKFGSGDKSGGMDYVVPDKIGDQEVPGYQYSVDIDEEGEVTEWANYKAIEIFESHMHHAQDTYNKLRKAGVPAEDARSVLPNAAATNLVMTVNLRALLDFYAKRKAGRGAQSEITQLAERLREEVVAVEGWTDKFFEEV
ncbi:FAD-dependent thymidylate synthase [Priestia megaterium]|uniref:FAD-dependent thymidylate synthase n=1 Tax=Priestia megaterium TaxID=1404 RepID=UPI00345B2CE1